MPQKNPIGIAYPTGILKKEDIVAMTRASLNYDLNMARDKSGMPLKSEQKELLCRLAEKPSIALWDACAGIVLVPPKINDDGKIFEAVTLWKAVHAINPSFPTKLLYNAVGKRTWDRIPSSDEIKQAIQYATH